MLIILIKTDHEVLLLSSCITLGDSLRGSLTQSLPGAWEPSGRCEVGGGCSGTAWLVDPLTRLMFVWMTCQS